MNAGAGSLGRRLVIGVTGITSAVVLVAGCGTWLTTRAVLTAGVDREIAQFIERSPRGEPSRPSGTVSASGSASTSGPATASATTSATSAPPATGSASRAGEGRRFRGGWGGPRGGLFQMATRPGHVLFSAPGLPEGSDLASDIVLPLAGPVVRDRTLTDGRAVRVVTVPGRRGDETYLASLAVDLEPLHAELGRLALILGGLWVTATGLALASALALRRALLRPVRALAASIDGIGPEDLSARLPSAAVPAELAVVAGRLNELLGRLDEAFRREQATLANIAHELRNPVAALRSAIEFRLPAAGEDERTTLEPCLATVVRMQAMVDNLLLLARVESGSERLPATRIDVAALVAAVAEDWEGRAAGRGQMIEAAVAPATVSAAEPHLRSILDNLIGNAVAHGSGDGAIAVAVVAAGGRVVVSVANPIDAPVDLARIGQPFQRGDAARTAAGHCGLGLALCRRLARLMGGDLRLAADGGVFTATLELPHLPG